jgi:hypothetical protein
VEQLSMVAWTNQQNTQTTAFPLCYQRIIELVIGALSSKNRDSREVSVAMADDT